MISKIEWRKILIEQRKVISHERRKEASSILIEKLYPRGKILSFSPFGSEIDIKPLNDLLSLENRLFLASYQFDKLSEIPLSEIDCILVPGLGFDCEKFRIGYGKGFYDRFLATVGHIPSIGIGFKEQFCTELLPHDPWDIPVEELLLV